MEGLRAKAKEDFLQGQKFLVPPDPIQPWQASLFMSSVVKICKRSSHVAFIQANVPHIDLLQNLKAPLGPCSDENPTTIFQLVKIDRGLEDGRILLAKNLFMDIFEEFGLDEYWLHLVQCWAYGFYQIQHRNPGHGPQHSCYLSMVSFTLIWSFNSHTSTTKAILIPRHMDGLINPGGIYGRFTSLLEAQKSLIDDLSFCSFVCACYLVHWIDSYIGLELAKIRNIEGATGYSQWKDENHDDDPGMESLAERSKKTGESLSSLANVARHVALAKTLLQKLKTGEGQVSTIASGEYDNAGPMSSADQIGEAITILQSQIEFSDHYTTYLQERARTQQPVIFNLLGGQDAKTNIEIAKSTKDDSSAMKTIAIMTMVFLPATFFAALFAIPTLQWEGPSVVQPRFWVYWAFTIPCTVLVFSVWYLILRRKKIGSFIRYSKFLPFCIRDKFRASDGHED